MGQRLVNRITLRHLRLVAAVAEHRQLSLAAKALSTTQPAASRCLRELEALCGEPLFERHARGMSLTSVGELLHRRAQNVLDEIQRAAEDVAEYRDGSGGTVRIGAVTGAAVGYVVPAIGRLKAAAPKAEIHVEVAMSADLVRELVAHRLDLVLARMPPDADASLFEVTPARHEDVDLIVRGNHPAAQGRVALADLVDQEWIMQEKGTPIRMAVEAALLAQGARLPLKVTNTSSLLVTLAMLGSSDAIAPVSREVAELLAGPEGRTGLRALSLHEQIAVHPYSLLALRTRRLSPIAQRCRKMLADMLRGSPASA